MSLRALVSVIGLVAAVGCGGRQGASVQRTLSSLPDARQDQNDAIESAGARPTAETKHPLPPALQRVEAGAATVAAIVGSLLSTSANTVVGIGAPVEILSGDPIPGRRPPAPPPPPDVDASTLVPWLRIAPPSAPPPPAP